jgi:hypothetical protein
MDDHGTAQPAATDRQQEDGRFGALERLVEEKAVTVRAADQDLVVMAHSAWPHLEEERHRDPRTVVALLPRIRSVLGDFATVRERATEYLWQWGASGEETAQERARFLGEAVPSILVVGPTAIEVHYEDLGEPYMMEGYWPAVHFDQDGIAVNVTVES